MRDTGACGDGGLTRYGHCIEIGERDMASCNAPFSDMFEGQPFGRTSRTIEPFHLLGCCIEEQTKGISVLEHETTWNSVVLEGSLPSDATACRFCDIQCC